MTQNEINEIWTERSDNYDTYVRDEFETDRPAKWLEKIYANVPHTGPMRILDAGCGPGRT